LALAHRFGLDRDHEAFGQQQLHLVSPDPLAPALARQANVYIR